jgi:hypothetical protein
MITTTHFKQFRITKIQEVILYANPFAGMMGIKSMEINASILNTNVPYP